MARESSLQSILRFFKSKMRVDTDAMLLSKNWGLTDEEVDSMPPTHASSFGALAPISTGFGSEMGLIEAEGTMVNAGRLLFRDQWNSDLYGPLKESWLEGKKNGTDVLIHKNRMSGAWGVSTALEEYLIKENITVSFSSLSLSPLAEISSTFRLQYFELM